MAFPRGTWLALVSGVLWASVVSAQPSAPLAPAAPAVLAPGGAPAPEEPLVRGVSLVHDNDNLPHPGNTLRDDNYSAGYEVRLTGRIVDEAGLTVPLAGVDWLTRMNRRHARAARRFHAVQLLGTVYTPDRIDTSAVQRDDRPYASLIALTVSRTSVSGTALDRAWSSELSLGMLGLGVTGDLQRLVHRTRRWMTGKSVPVDPRGWSNQISAGGEPTARYRVIRQQRLAGDAPPGHRQHWDIVGAIEGRVGYDTSAAAAISGRLGAFSSAFWEVPRGVTSPAGGSRDARASGVPRWDLFAFGVLRPRLVLYDALLQGQFRRSVFTVPPRHLLGEWEGGVGASSPLGPLRVELVVQLAQGRTADFVGPKARNYTWGTVGIVVSRRGLRPPGSGRP